MELAQIYDQSEGKYLYKKNYIDIQLWKMRNESSLYDYKFIEQLMNLLKESRKNNDI